MGINYWKVCVSLIVMRGIFLYLLVSNHLFVHRSDDEIQFDVLPNCASYIQVKLKRVTDGGDHDVAICEVVGVGTWNNEEQTVVWQSDDDDKQSTAALDHTSVLYSGKLRQEGVI